MSAIAGGPRTIGTLAEPFPMSLVAVSKHIGVLERAGLVSRARQGRAQVVTLRPDAMREAAAWLDGYRRFWTDRLESLERYLTKEESG